MKAWNEVIDEWSNDFATMGIEWEGEVPQVPSPSWWGADSRLVKGNSTEYGPVMLKTISRHAWSWRNRANMVSASRAAGDLGIAPKVIHADEEMGVLLLERLGPEWRVGRLDLFLDSEIRKNIHSARARFAESDVSLTTRSPLIDLNQLVDECSDREIDLDPRLQPLLDYVNQFREPLLEYRETLDMKPSQGDAAISNVMVNPEGDIRLIGWGSAAALSDIHDKALLITEACPGALDMKSYIGELLPEASEKDRGVLELVTGIEHLRWAVLTQLRSVVDPDVNLDAIKYGLWHMTFAELIFNKQQASKSLEGVLS